MNIIRNAEWLYIIAHVNDILLVMYIIINMILL